MLQIEDLLKNQSVEIDLFNPQTADEFRQMLNDSLFTAEPKVPLIISSVLNIHLASVRDELVTSNPILLARYEHFLKILIALRLPLLASEDLFALLKGSLVEVIQEGIVDFVERFQVRFVLQNPLSPPSVWLKERDEILRMLRANVESIGSHVLLNTERIEVPPTLQNWLRDYDRFTADKRVRTEIKRQEYLTRVQGQYKLSEDIRDTLRKVLALYDLFYLDPQYVRPLLGTSATSSIVAPLAKPAESTIRPSKPPIFVTITPPMTPVRLLDQEKIVQFERELEDNLHVVVGEKRIHKFGNLFLEAIRVQDQERAIAVVRLLARANAVGRLLQERSENICIEFTESLRRKYGAAYTLAFDAHPDKIQFQMAFLDWLFREKMNLMEADATRQREIIISLLV